MKKALFILVLIFAVNTTVGQRINSTDHRAGSTDGPASDITNYKNSIEVKDEYNNIEGSPYVNDSFQTALILPLNGKFTARYNAVEDLMEVKKKDGSDFILDKEANYTIQFPSKTYKVFNTNGDLNNPTFEYFIVELELKNVSLLKKETKKFYEEKVAATTYSADKPARFDKEHKTKLYIKTNSKLEPISTKTKRFLALFPDQKDTIKKYIKDNNISLKKEDQLLKLLKYINTLF